MDTKPILCHGLPAQVGEQKSTKLSIDRAQADELNSIHKLFTFTPIKKVDTIWYFSSLAQCVSNVFNIVLLKRRSSASVPNV